MVMEKVPRGVRGDLSRWMIELKPGVFVGKVNAMVRDKLWERCCDRAEGGAVLQIWSSNNEQGFSARSYGILKREIIDYEGIWLVRHE